MSPQTLAKATGSTLADAQKYALPLEAAMNRFGIDTAKQRAAFIATVAVESTKLTSVEESLYYKDADRLASIYTRLFHGEPRLAAPYTRNSAKLGEALYQGYWGRGLIQLTWLANYQNCSAALGQDFVAYPELLTQPEWAAMSAAWFWYSKGCNGPADMGDMTEVTRIVNGPRLMHLAERKAAYATALQASV
jgi:putative chitinase